MSVPRTLVIGLDGATFDVIDPLVRAGCLPAIQRMMEQGTRGTLNAFPDMNSAAAWSSLVTGCNAGKHGIFHFDPNWYRLAQKGIRARPTTGADRQRAAFWRVLSDAGQRVGVVNVPITYPAEEIKGFMLAGMDTPGVHSKGFCYPASLYAELQAHNIPYEIDTINLARPAQQDPYHLPDRVKQMTGARANALLYLMETRGWDVLMGVFVATDRVQHFYWHGENADVHSLAWQPLRELYQQLDAFIASALARTGPDTHVLIVSDHGFGRKRDALHLLNEAFAQWGTLGYAGRARDRQGSLLANLLQHGRRLVPLSLQYPLARLFPALHLRALTASSFSKIDWAHTQMFADPDGWGVYLNLQGREPEGIVPPGEYQTVRQEARQRLLQLRDGHTKRPLLRAVHEREKLYTGPMLECAPDLMLEWDFDAVGDTLGFRDKHEWMVLSRTSPTSSDEKWKATHRPDGIFIGYGPHIQQGQILTGLTLYDIVPTLLYLQEQPVPEGLDGRAATGLFEEEYVRAHPVRFSQQVPMPLANSDTPSDTDLAPVEERLRALGYLDP